MFQHQKPLRRIISVAAYNIKGKNIMKKLLSTALIMLLVLSLCSCGYELKLVKKEKPATQAADETEEPTVEADISLPLDAETLPEGETLPPETEAPETEAPSAEGVSADGAEFFTLPEEATSPVPFSTVVMDKASVVALYTNAVNNVKAKCPGYTKREDRETGDVTAGSGALQLANNILNLVGTELLKNGGDTESYADVAPGSEAAVRAGFPVYNADYGCRVDDLSLIESAVCLSNGSEYRIEIKVADTLNPEPGDGVFGNIMTPVKRENIANGISEYLVVLDRDQYKFDFNYTDNEIVCVLDAATGRIKSLTQKMTINVDIDLDLDLMLFKTNVVEAHGKIMNTLSYSDFIW